MRKIKQIPKKISILDSEVKVKLKDDLVSGGDKLGLANLDFDKIEIQKPGKTFPLKDSTVIRVFWHEVTHMILHKLSYHDLCVDEDFVERFSSVLNQVTKDMIYLEK